MKDAVPVPDAVTGDVDIARPQNCPFHGVLVNSYAEVQGTAEHNPQLFYIIVAVDERSCGLVGDPPKAELQVLAVDDPPPEAGTVSLLEHVIVEEVHVSGVGGHESPQTGSDQLAEHPALHLGQMVTGRSGSTFFIICPDRLSNISVGFRRDANDLIHPVSVDLRVEE